jgi:hypothetical protein
MAWTVALTWDASYDWSDGNRVNVFKFACTADGSGSGDQQVSTLLATTYGTEKGGWYFNEMVRGGRPLQVVYIPSTGGTAPGSNPTVTLDDANGGVMFSKEFTATTPLTQLVDDLGGHAAAKDIILASTTMGDGKKGDIELWIIK